MCTVYHKRMSEDVLSAGNSIVIIKEYMDSEQPGVCLLKLGSVICYKESVVKTLTQRANKVKHVLKICTCQGWVESIGVSIQNAAIHQTEII